MIQKIYWTFLMSLSHCTRKREHSGIIKGNKFKVDTRKYFLKLRIQDILGHKFKVKIDFIQMINQLKQWIWFKKKKTKTFKTIIWKKLCILDISPKKSSFHFPQRHLGLLLGRKLLWMNYECYPKHSCKWSCKTENPFPYNCSYLSCCYKLET